MGRHGLILWRISRFTSLDGQGGVVVEGRWHTVGQPVLYCAEHPALALLETVVHFGRSSPPGTFQLLEIATSAETQIVDYPDATAPADPVQSRRFGDLWLGERRSPLLRVPSVLVPRSFNLLVNPVHPDTRLHLQRVHAHTLDPRFAPENQRV